MDVWLVKMLWIHVEESILSIQNHPCQLVNSKFWSPTISRLLRNISLDICSFEDTQLPKHQSLGLNFFLKLRASDISLTVVEMIYFDYYQDSMAWSVAFLYDLWGTDSPLNHPIPSYQIKRSFKNYSQFTVFRSLRNIIEWLVYGVTAHHFHFKTCAIDSITGHTCNSQHFSPYLDTPSFVWRLNSDRFSLQSFALFPLQYTLRYASLHTYAAQRHQCILTAGSQTHKWCWMIR